MKSVEELVPAASLSTLFDYDRETGSLTWKPRGASSPEAKRWNKRYAGREAGAVSTGGYRKVTIRTPSNKRLTIYVHLIAWAISHGAWPEKEVDHRNSVNDDNRLSNLREATHQQNCRNRRLRRDNAVGLKGVSWHPRERKFVAKIDNKWLGYFSTAEEASRRYQAEAKARHGEFARVA